MRHTQQHGMEIKIIPGAYTGALQVLDKGINRPFKGRYKTQQLCWQIHNIQNAKPARAQVARWIDITWGEITQDIITNTWRSIGLAIV